MDRISFRGIAAALFFINEPYRHGGMGSATSGWACDGGWLAFVGGWGGRW